MLTVAALYHFAPLPDPAALRAPLLALCEAHGVRGTIILAPEGVNGTIAGPRAGVDAVLAHLRGWPGCAGLAWKESAAAAMPFGRMKVRVKREIVTMGEPQVDPTAHVGRHVPPAEWNALIADPEVVVIDTRNAYEIAIGSFVLVIGAAYVAQLVAARPDLAAFGQGFVPSFQGVDSVYLAVGIIGATVMPHVIYLHSALTQGRVPTRNDEEKLALARLNRVDVGLAMGLAGLINISMLAVAAATFYGKGIEDAGNLETAYRTLTPLLGAGAAVTFAVALLASGLSSSAVGTMSGQVIMQGFIGIQIPLWLRRSITMAPAFVVIWLGLDPTATLVLSQVILSFGVPFALIPLLMFTARRDVMGVLTSSRLVTALGWLFAALIIGLNAYLLWGTLVG